MVAVSSLVNATTDRALSEAIELARKAGIFVEPAPSTQTIWQQLQEAIDPLAISRSCQSSPIGKKLPGALYIHHSALETLEPLLRLYEARARFLLGGIEGATIVKFGYELSKVSYLFYPEFDLDPHPELHCSIRVELSTGQVSYRDYQTSDNPPVLHRKETFVTPNYPHYETFAQLTHQEELCGLLDNPKSIGTRENWVRCLHDAGVEIQEHQLVRCQDASGNPVLPKIERHRAALDRRELSRPVRLTLEAGLFAPGNTFFDYGCGYGGDVRRISKRGYKSTGWDPYYAPDVVKRQADIVNLGYVINVIEDTGERRDALIAAWDLTGRVLIVSAQVAVADRDRGQVVFGDGVITRRRTFQKYYEQEELKLYIEGVLDREAIPVALGIYLVFRDESSAETFRASRFRSRTSAPKVRKPSRSFEDDREILAPLMEFVGERGRLPVKGELDRHPEILAEFGSFRRAFKLILQATEPEAWEAIAEKRRQDLLIYLALTHFGRRPQLKQFTPPVQQDIKALFGSLKQALIEAEDMLFSVGDLTYIAQLCQESPIGLLAPKSLLVHISALVHLDPFLRVYEGCASRTIGRMEWANAIEIHTRTPKISYLYYRDFDTEPHPVLHTAMQIDLRDLQVRYFDCDTSDNPPILHRKEKLVTPDYPLYEKFAKLSQQEENWGLLDDFGAIARYRGWQECLSQHCAELRGYRVCWRKDADPYRVRVLRAALRRRQARAVEPEQNV
ncbi:MAG: DNA phosphorothioation-associated putative methyltransferase [Cyanobacteriota bacterium]|nr:DNA phosphorothioation-associated putative methyltransferase [Cyanobacteriota bacterium]